MWSRYYFTVNLGISPSIEISYERKIHLSSSRSQYYNKSFNDNYYSAGNWRKTNQQKPYYLLLNLISHFYLKAVLKDKELTILLEFASMLVCGGYEAENVEWYDERGRGLLWSVVLCCGVIGCIMMWCGLVWFDAEWYNERIILQLSRKITLIFLLKKNKKTFLPLPVELDYVKLIDKNRITFLLVTFRKIKI